MKKIFYGLLWTFFSLSLLTGFLYRIQIKEAIETFLKPRLPEAKSAAEFKLNEVSVLSNESSALKTSAAPSSSGISSSAPSSLTPSSSVPASTETQKIAPVSATKLSGELPAELPGALNLNIPFASQAPFGNWDMPYQETCEEASVIMAHRYFTGQSLDADTMDKELLALIKWEEETFGYYKDTTAEEVARILREYFGHKKVEVLYEFTIDDIKKEIAAGHPVILPAAGRLLPNPYFRQPGPVYHALVVKGYTESKIITNDPGTRKGKDFLYDPQTLMKAIHNWNAENILDGEKVMIVVYPP